MKLLNAFSKTALALSFLISSVAFAEVAVIVSAQNPNYSLDKTDVEQIFLGKKSVFPNGDKAIPVDQAENSAVRNEFNQKALGKNSNQLKAYWSRLIFTGKGTPPKELGNDADVIAQVAENPNLIGYVNSDAVEDSSVKIMLKF